MKRTNSAVFGVIGIWDLTGYDLGLVERCHNEVTWDSEVSIVPEIST